MDAHVNEVVIVQREEHIKINFMCVESVRVLSQAEVLKPGTNLVRIRVSSRRGTAL